ncbi:MAG: hypothetical protein JW751_11355, partial [Polyangiaceae bacterium]|nr:hypothetical protein [Polyangiaceae bacterium]
MMRNGFLRSVALLGILSVLVGGCKKDKDDDDDSQTGGTGSGGAPTGGVRTTGGAQTTGGVQTTGGAQTTGGTGAATTGGTGAATTGGTGAATTGGTGAATTGGTGAATTGGAGGTGGGAPLEYCYASLFAPLAEELTGTDFQIDFGASSLVDLSATTMAVTLRADTAGNAGGIQVFVKNGADQEWAAAYLVAAEDSRDEPMAWWNITDLEDWTTLTYDLSTATGGDGFDMTEVRYVGINVATGDPWPDGTHEWGDTTVYVDSITFSTDLPADIEFNADTGGFEVGDFQPIDGSVVAHAPCEAQPGTGGAGGGGGAPPVTGGGAGTPSEGGGAGTPSEGGGAGTPSEGG